MRFRVIAALLSFAVGLWSWPQSTTFSTDVRVVNLFAVVHDSAGRIRSDLTQDEFQLQVDGEPQVIRYFSRQTGLPLTLGLLVDTSASMLQVFDDERAASTKFLKQVLREKSDQGFLMHFDRGVELLQGLTPSRRKLQAGLGVLDSQTWYSRQMERRRTDVGTKHGVSTALYDAVVEASDAYMRSQQGRKAIILLSDGVDDGSTHSLNDAVGAALRADTLVYSIHIFSRTGDSVETKSERRQREIALGKQVLMRLSQQTGGGFFEVSERENVGEIFGEIEAELRSQYSVGFSPTAEGAATGFHRVALRVREKGLVVQTRAGYFVGR